MGFHDGKIFRLTLFAVLLLSAVSALADKDSGVAAELQDFVMPHYRKGELQFILYGERGINLGSTITFTNPLIDIVVNHLPDVELVTLMNKVRVPDPDVKKISKANPNKLYPLYSSWKVVSDFWALYPHSQAVISSPDAVYEKNRRTLSGDGRVYFRSRDLDIDGVGFDADQKKKTVHVRSRVKVEFRPNGRVLTKAAQKALQEKMKKLNLTQTDQEQKGEEQ